MEEDEFLVLACDGVWDVMTNEDICQFVAARMRITDDLELIANEVIDTCLHKVRKLIVLDRCGLAHRFRIVVDMLMHQKVNFELQLLVILISRNLPPQAIRLFSNQILPCDLVIVILKAYKAERQLVNWHGFLLRIFFATKKYIPNNFISGESRQYEHHHNRLPSRAQGHE